ncbi:MAG: hypothetical protein SCH39_08945 [Methanosarcinales archaeon]|nr:hypothetical protein [ANME-2 cluster archaeon]MDW7776441.1 hypothetical protein [Methanosarcinales archaeon]
MDHTEKIFEIVKQYDITKSVEGKNYVVNRLRNYFRLLDRQEQKITMAMFVVLELNRTHNLNTIDLAEKISCLTNLDKNDIFNHMAEYMAEYLTIAG